MHHIVVLASKNPVQLYVLIVLVQTFQTTLVSFDVLICFKQSRRELGKNDNYEKGDLSLNEGFFDFFVESFSAQPIC